MPWPAEVRSTGSHRAAQSVRARRLDPSGPSGQTGGMQSRPSRSPITRTSPRVCPPPGGWPARSRGLAPFRGLRSRRLSAGVRPLPRLRSGRPLLLSGLCVWRVRCAALVMNPHSWRIRREDVARWQAECTSTVVRVDGKQGMDAPESPAQSCSRMGVPHSQPGPWHHPRQGVPRVAFATSRRRSRPSC